MGSDQIHLASPAKPFNTFKPLYLMVLCSLPGPFLLLSLPIVGLFLLFCVAAEKVFYGDIFLFIQPLAATDSRKAGSRKVNMACGAAGKVYLTAVCGEGRKSSRGGCVLIKVTVENL